MGTRVDNLSGELAIVKCSGTVGSDTATPVTPQKFGSVQPRSFSMLKLGQLEQLHNSLKEQVQALKEKSKPLDQRSGALEGSVNEASRDPSEKVLSAVAQLGIAVNKIGQQVNTMAQGLRNLHERIVGLEKRVFTERGYMGSSTPMALQHTLSNGYVLQRPTASSTQAQLATVDLTGNVPHRNERPPQQQPGRPHSAQGAPDPRLQAATRPLADPILSRQRPPQPVGQNPQHPPGTFQLQQRAPQPAQQPPRGSMALPSHPTIYQQLANWQHYPLQGPR
ncbi:hypothetical protein BCR34DRAFT_616561 [Clohesyomyces aquaticus]|uniref:Uncharacterized protein n=1 Tax=Clohesyomyces aquaticus TaxID=1231657 RepID=A0A1Y1ZD96_9PLEO|nr:hypothetical protein BCR34DRAFT_616561 [Clohesyomyces aquaticus]